MTKEQKALEILRKLADIAAAGNSLTIAEDWGFGSATLIDQDGAHTHFGRDHCENEEKNFEAFVNGLHGLLVESRGLSWVKPSNVQGDRRCAASSRSVQRAKRTGSTAGLGL